MKSAHMLEKKTNPIQRGGKEEGGMRDGGYGESEIH